MRRALLVFLSGCMACGLVGTGLSQEGAFSLAIDAPEQISGDVGETVSFTATATLTSALPEDARGVEAWSIGVAAENGILVSATVDGTAAAPVAESGLVQEDGFELTELTVGAGNQGIISAVVLSSGSDVTLPPVGTVSLLKLNVEAEIPAPIVSAGSLVCLPTECSVAFVNGLQGKGQPVSNKVSVQGEAIRPPLTETVVEVCPRIFEPRFTLSVETPGTIEGTEGEIVQFEAAARLSTTENPGSYGAQGWSIGLTASNGAITLATVDGTAGAAIADGGYRASDGFVLTELTTGAGNEGVISAVVLSTGQQTPATLPPEGTESLLRLSLEAEVPSPIVTGGQFVCAPLKCIIDYRNGLKGPGQPVDNKVTYNGLAYRPDLIYGSVDVCPEIPRPRFALTVSAPEDVVGEAGSLVTFEAVAQLTTTESTESDGAQGWSIGLAATECVITDATVDGTAADTVENGGLREPDGFQRTELTTGEGNLGAISAVVLSSGSAVTLPPAGTSDLLRVTLSALVPEPVVAGGQFVCGPRSCRVLYRNGLTGLGQPVDNKVTYRGLAFRPSLLAGIVEVCPEISQAKPDFEYSLDAPSSVEGEPGSLVQFGATVELTTTNNPTEDGAQGWSTAVRPSESCEIVDATVDGTSAALVTEGGLRQADGFEQTELTTGPDNEGAVSAVILSIGGLGGALVTLPADGTADVLRLTVQATVPERTGETCDPLVCDLSFADGLQGSGLPTDNKVTYVGFSYRPDLTGTTISVCPAGSEGGRQKPGDENQDAELDISDPIAVLSFLFLGTNPSLPCGDGSASDPANLMLLDMNGDGELDLSDPVWTLNFLFLGGDPPVMCGAGDCPCISIPGCPDNPQGECAS